MDWVLTLKFRVESTIKFDNMGSCLDLYINTILLFQQNWPTVVWYNLFDHGRPFLSLIPLSAECLRAILDKLGCTPICSQICKKNTDFRRGALVIIMSFVRRRPLL